DRELFRNYVHRFLQLAYALRQLSQARQDTSVTTGGSTVHRINSASTTNSTSPFSAHNRFTTGKAQRPTSRRNKVVNVPARSKPRQHTAARITMAMPPPSSKIIAIGGTVVTPSRVHIRPRIRTVIWQRGISVRLERTWDNLQKTLASASASAVHVHNLLIAVRNTARLRHNLIQHSVNLTGIVSVETVTAHSCHSHLAPRLTVARFAATSEESAYTFLNEVPCRLRKSLYHSPRQYTNETRAAP